MYIVIMIGSVIAISVDNFDFTTNSTAVISCFNNIGPAFDAAGPMSSYAGYNAFSKLLLSLAMLMGRLEIFPILLTFLPGTWVKK